MYMGAAPLGGFEQLIIRVEPLCFSYHEDCGMPLTASCVSGSLHIMQVEHQTLPSRSATSLAGSLDVHKLTTVLLNTSMVWAMMLFGVATLHACVVARGANLALQGAVIAHCPTSSHQV